MSCSLIRAAAFVALFFVAVGQSSAGTMLLNDTFDNGSGGFDLPNETTVWFGTRDNVTENAGSFSYTTDSSSQKMHFYFAPPGKFSRLGVGDTLSVAISFIPRDGINFDDTSRSYRFGVFHDPSDPQVLQDTNDDGGGSGDPWTDAEGYGVQMAMLSQALPDNDRSVFDLGKRTDLLNTSVLGSSGAYTKSSGGDPVAYALDTEYTVTMEINKVSEVLTTVTTTLADAGGVLSSYTVNDDGAELGTAAPYDRFSFVHFRTSNAVETADAFEYTSVVVTGPALVPEPTSLALLLLGGIGMFVRRR